MSQEVRSSLLALAGLAAFLGVWEAIPRLGVVSPALLPAPSQIPPAFWTEIVGGHWHQALLASLGHYLIGLALGSALGIGLGVTTGMSSRLDAALSWVVRLLRPIPGLAWVPFAILWFGVSASAATFIIVIGVFWINHFAALGAVQTVDRDLIEVAEAFGHRGRLAKLVKVILPAASAGILSGLRTGLGQAWMGRSSRPSCFGVAGLGQRMMQASSLLATDVVVVYMITIAACYGAFDSAFLVLRNWLLRWRP